MNRREIAMNYFSEGYNCAQSVVLAFADLTDMDSETLVRLASSFGGGLGRLREVCGCVSGMSIIAGILYGYADPKAGPTKNNHYARIQELALQFEKDNGSIVCRTLLGLSSGTELTEGGHDVPIAAVRTEEYYRKRPCRELVGMAAGYLEDYINSHEQTD